MSVSLAAGARVGSYTLGAKLGAGASGLVFEAVRDDGVRAALKVLREESAGDAEAVARMRREASVLRALAHPSIVAALDVGTLEGDGRPWIAMERVEGESLRAVIARGEVNGDSARAWALQRPVCDALSTAHERGVIHRDVKPENILVSADGVARLVDFGLARSVDPSGASLTGPGAAVGTPPYMPPELWWNADVTPAVDQYALGCTLFELLTGRAPFSADSFGGWMEAHLHGAVPTASVASSDAERSAAIDRFFRRALAKDPRDRFASMRALMDEADALFGVAVTPPSRRGPSWAVAWALLGALGLPIVGHGGEHAPKELFRLAGWSAFVLVALAFASVFVALRRRSVAALAGACATAGVFGASTGWAAVLSVAQRTPAEGRFSLLHEGLHEADINRAFGYWTAWGALCATLSLLPRGRVTSVARVSLFALATLAAGLLSIGASSAGLCALLALATTWAAAGCARASRDEALSQLGLGLCATLAAIGACGARIGAAESAVWRSGLDRATRVARLTELARERSLWALAAALSAVALVAALAPELRALGWRERGAAWLRARAPWLLAFGCVALGDGWLRARVESARGEARRAIAGQFALFSRLEVPSASGLPSPHVGPSVQIAADVVGVDGVPVLRVAGLETERGRASLSADLAHRLASDRASDDAGRARWTLAIDRRTPWSSVRAVLAIARDLGAGPVEVLFARSANPRWTVWAPPESALVLPGDYGALVLAPSTSADAATFDAGLAFEQVGAALRARAERPVRVFVDRP